MEYQGAGIKIKSLNTKSHTKVVDIMEWQNGGMRMEGLNTKNTIYMMKK